MVYYAVCSLVCAFPGLFSEKTEQRQTTKSKGEKDMSLYNDVAMG